MGKNKKHGVTMGAGDVTVRNGKTSKSLKRKKMENGSTPKKAKLKSAAHNVSMSSTSFTPFLELVFDEEKGSIENGKECLEWMISPITSTQFFEKSWENAPVYIKRANSDYYDGILSTKDVENIILNNDIQFGKNLDVTSFKDGERETHNPPGRAYAPVVWDFYKNGCSLRMLNPQTFHEPVWRLCATLQDFFGCMVGANLYLTPPGTQGFAPHYDDVDVFILQLEGKKHWRVYEPRTAQEQLPRFSSPNFKEDEIGEPCLDITISAGDMLYMPRGTIHQGNCLEDEHSLHVTISCYQTNTYGDLLAKVLPEALNAAMEEDLEFRKGLPLNYLKFMGVSNSDSESADRSKFIDHMKGLVEKLFTYVPLDAGADQMGKKFLEDKLPPFMSPSEKARSVEGAGERWSEKKKKVKGTFVLELETEVRLIRAHCCRLVTEEDGVQLYYSVENTREYHEKELPSMEVDSEVALAIEQLMNTYPEYTKIDDLPLDDDEQKLAVVQDLWEKKLVLPRVVDEEEK